MELELIDSLASDLMVVKAARVSMNKDVTEFTEADDGLIRYLMQNGHGSPFEHGIFIFRVKAPIFVIREWQRHRTWSFNEMSARYTRLEDAFYEPVEMRQRVGKPGHYSYVEHPRPYSSWNKMEKAYAAAWAAYEMLLDDGVAPEQARAVLPVGTYSQMIASVDPRNLMRFLGLRTHETAQKEIRDLAFIAEDHFANIMPRTYHWWHENGRITP